MISFISWLWAGLIIGISFIAAPAKFLANTPTFHQLLEVGQVTFNTFKYAEFFLFPILIVCLLNQLTISKIYRYLLPSMCLLMVVQHGYLLPLLDARVNTLLQGQAIEPSSLHFYYVLVEVAKLIILLSLGAAAYLNTQGVKTHAID